MPPNIAALYTGVTAPEGVRWAGGFDFEEMGQLLQTPLTPGQQYTFSAFVRSAHGMEGSFEIYLGTSVNTYTTQVAVLPPNTGFVDGWELQTATFIAPANAATTPWLTFKSYQADPEFGNGTYMGIDDVRLVATPEPTAVGLVCLACASLVGVRRFARCSQRPR
jgi:hypothetical protein